VRNGAQLRRAIDRKGEEMDPDAAAQYIIDALREDDLPGAAMAMEDLEHWLRRGGVPPKSAVLAELVREVLNNWARLHRT